MIIVRIYGGLGNQLFQYAAAKALASFHKTEFKLDISEFEKYSLRNFDLAKLNMNISLATDLEIMQLKATSALERVKAKFSAYERKKFYKESFFHFDPKFFQLGNHVYLQGYFQSEKYFLSIAGQLRSELDFSHLVSDNCIRLALQLEQTPSVAIHIRLGDYQDKDALKIHGLLPIDYYVKAIKYVEEKFSNVKFYIFSDNPQKAVETLNKPDAVMISGNETHNHFEDIYLMSHCRHNIIANSSFSWWGAWLNKNQDKTVVAPKKWFNKGPKDTFDIIPGSWQKL